MSAATIRPSHRATSDADRVLTEIEIRPATQLIQQLSSKDEAAQLDAAEHITAVCFKLRGQEYRDFQDSLKPALQLLTEMVRRPNPLAPPVALPILLSAPVSLLRRPLPSSVGLQAVRICLL